MAKVALNLESDIQPISEFRANTSEMLERVRETGQPIVLTRRGRGAAVLLDVGVYQRMLEQLEELKDVQRGLEDVAAGRVQDHDEVADRLMKRLEE